MRTAAPQWVWLLRLHLRHGLLEFPPPGSPWLSAARRALVVAGFFAAGLATDTLHLTILGAFGALQVGLMEAVRPGRALAAVLGASVVAMSLTAFVASAVGGTWWVVPLVAVLGYGYGCVGRLGLGPLAVSLGALALAVIFAGIPQTPAEAAVGALWVGIGGLVQMGLWLVDLRHDRRAYVRRILAIKATSMAHIARGGVVNERVVERSFTVTERAREVLRTAGLPADEHAAFEAVLAAELQTLRALLTWLELRQPGLAARMLVALHLEAAGRALKSGRPVAATWSTPSQVITLDDDPSWLATRSLCDTLDGLVAATSSAASRRRAPSGADPGGPALARPNAAAEIPILGGVEPEVAPVSWRSLTAALRPSSPGATFGLRMALALAVAESLTILLSIGHSFWLPLTVVFILRPEVVNTLLRSLTRLAGNLAAVILVPTLLALATGNDAARSMIVLMLAAITFRYFTGNYALTSFGLAGTVLVLDSTLTPGHDLFLTRVLATAAGAALALLVVILIPTGSSRDSATRIAGATAAFGLWATRVCCGLARPGGLDRMDLARSLTASRTELLGLGTAAEAALFDPHTRREGVDLVVALDAAWRVEIALLTLSFYTRVLHDAQADGLPTRHWCEAIDRQLQRAQTAGVRSAPDGAVGSATAPGTAPGTAPETDLAGTGKATDEPAGTPQLGVAETQAVTDQLQRLEAGVRDLVSVASASVAAPPRGQG